MKSKKLQILLVLLFAISKITYTQIWIDNKDIYGEAEEFMHGEEYREALPLYTLLESKGVSNSNINYKIGKCYLKISGKETKAIPYLESAIENITISPENVFEETKAPQDAYILLGIAHRINQNFDKAIEVFSKYKDLVQGNPEETLANYHISTCLKAKIMSQNPTKSSLQEINTTSKYPLYNPVLSREGTIFYMEKRPFYDAIIEADIKGAEILNEENLTPIIKSDGDHVLVSSNRDGNKIILRSYQAERGYELYYAEKQEGEWGEYMPFPEPVNSLQNDIFASFSAGGDTLYFCSNRTGGKGGADIYMSVIENGKWSEPANLGGKINTSFDETSVFITKDNQKLFFTSEGHLNIGGTDFFVSLKDSNGNWGVPINLGSPVSTPGDDNFLSPTNERNIFYTYRNNREKEGVIYRVNLDEEALLRKVLVNGQLGFTNAIPGKKVPYVVHSENEGVPVSGQTNAQGEYALLLTPGEYKVTFTYDKQHYAEQTVNIEEEGVDEFLLPIPEWESSTAVMDKDSLSEKLIFVIKDILFGFDSYKLDAHYFEFLDSISTLLNTENSINVEIVGHTDSKGTALYNSKLSNKRAGAVKRYLVNKGVEEPRILVIAKGEKVPVAKNSNSDGSDNSLGRKFNRRVTLNLLYDGDEIQVKRVVQVPQELKVK